MKTSHLIIRVLSKSNFPITSSEIARLLPGLTQKQVQCSLTRLVSNRTVSFKLSKNHTFGNNKENRFYYIAKKDNVLC